MCVYLLPFVLVSIQAVFAMILFAGGSGTSASMSATALLSVTTFLAYATPLVFIVAIATAVRRRAWIVAAVLSPFTVLFTYMLIIHFASK